MADGVVATRPWSESRRLLLPLALAQFICSFAGSNMNVMINDISEDLDTTVQGVQVAITLFLLVMAALIKAPTPYTDRPTVKQRLRPYRSVSLPPGIISAAITSRNRVIATCTPWTVVSRSWLMSLIIT
ncbi:MAG TPA: hypothetical protein VNB91_05690, partial [Jatrophihabitantaceae bacterium]|nr:hypothetical protein [Jatrophihabitantaceae bacterium]